MNNTFKCIDIHNHSIWSDGEATLREVIKNAIGHGIDTVGFSDHYGVSASKSVSTGNLKNYIEEISDLKRYYSGRIQVLSGIEVSAHLIREDVNSITYDSFNDLDIILIEDVESIHDSTDFYETIRKLDSFSCEKGLAHCNLVRLCEQFSLSFADLGEIMTKHNLFWEINSAIQHSFFDDVIYYDREKAPQVTTLFHELNSKGVHVSVGSDTHSLDEFAYGRLVQANKIMYEYLMPKVFTGHSRKCL